MSPQHLGNIDVLWATSSHLSHLACVYSQPPSSTNPLGGLHEARQVRGEDDYQTSEGLDCRRRTIIIAAIFPANLSPGDYTISCIFSADVHPSHFVA